MSLRESQTPSPSPTPTQSPSPAPASANSKPAEPLLRLKCAYEKLTGRYGTSDAFVGINVMPIWDKDVAPPFRRARYLCPWTWTLDGALLYRLKGDTWERDESTKPETVSYDESGGYFDSLKNVVQAIRYDCECKLETASVFHPAAGTAEIVDPGVMALPWTFVLGETWRLPAPMPERLQVSSMWKVALDPEDPTWLILPKWTIDAKTWSPPRTFRRRGSHYALSYYTTGAKHHVRVEFALREQPGKGAFLDVANLTADLVRSSGDPMMTILDAARGAALRLWDRWVMNESNEEKVKAKEGDHRIVMRLLGFDKVGKEEKWRDRRGLNGLRAVENVGAGVRKDLAKIREHTGSPDISDLQPTLKTPREREQFIAKLPGIVARQWSSKLSEAADSEFQAWSTTPSAPRQLQEWLADGLAASWVKAALHRVSVRQIPKNGDFLGILRSEITIEFDRLAKELGLEDQLSFDLADDGSSEQTGPVAFQFDQPWRRDQDSEDLLTRINGVALLMRRRGSSTWRSPNVAAVRTASKPSGAPPKGMAAFPGEEGIPAVLLASRIVDQGPARQAILTYDNAPMGALGPLAFANLNLRKPGSTAPIDYVDAVTRPEGSPLRPLAEWGRIPALAFGHTYETRGILVSQTNALPVWAAETGRPTRLKNPSQVEAPANPDSDWKYERTTRIGPPRIEGTSEDRSPFYVPPTVALRSAEFQEPKPQPRPKGALPGRPTHRAADAGARHPDSLPTVLLSESAGNNAAGEPWNSRSLRVSPPTCDFKTWERWVAFDFSGNPIAGAEAAKKLKAKVAEVLKSQAEYGQRTVPVTFDDPFATGKYVAQLVDLESGTPYWSAKLDYTTALSVSIRAGATVARTASGFVLPPGHVYRLDIHAEVQEDQVKARFDGKSHSKPLKLDDETTFHAGLTPASLFVESASDLMPAFDQWKDRINIKLTDPRFLDLTAEFPRELEHAQNVGSLTLVRQKWRWDGRAVEVGSLWHGHPEDSSLVDLQYLPKRASETATEKWETGQFCDRTRDDAIHSAFRGELTKSPKAPMTAALTKEESDKEKAQRKLAARFETREPLPDDRATFYRFGFVARSRYAEAFPDRNLDEGTFGNPQRTGPSDDESIPWRRILLRQRGMKDKVPTPSVKILLPLTGTLADEGKTESHSPLLLVLNESWFEVGGLAETLAVKIGCSTTGEEQGPDPRFDAGSGAIAGLIQPVCRGPLGFTFDRSDTDALFNTAAFLIKPTVNRNDAPNWLTKLKFQRVLVKEGVFAKDAATDDPRLRSAWTPEYWGQFIRAFDRSPAKSMEPWSTRNGLVAILANPRRAVSGKTFFYDFGVLTRVVPDLAGGPSQERFVAFLKRKADNQGDEYFRPEGQYENQPLPDGRYRCRFAEVELSQRQVRDGATWRLAARTDGPVADFIGNHLFPPNDRARVEDSDARIVSWSMPVETTIGEGGR